MNEVMTVTQREDRDTERWLSWKTIYLLFSNADAS